MIVASLHSTGVAVQLLPGCASPPHSDVDRTVSTLLKSPSAGCLGLFVWAVCLGCLSWSCMGSSVPLQGRFAGILRVVNFTWRVVWAFKQAQAVAWRRTQKPASDIPYPVVLIVSVRLHTQPSANAGSPLTVRKRCPVSHHRRTRPGTRKVLRATRQHPMSQLTQDTAITSLHGK